MSKELLAEPVQKQVDSSKSSERLEESPGSRQSANARILQLQRAIGNLRVAELIRSGQITRDGELRPIQHRLRIGAPDDPCEQEAERVARQVLSAPAALSSAPSERKNANGSSASALARAASVRPLEPGFGNDRGSPPDTTGEPAASPTVPPLASTAPAASDSQPPQTARIPGTEHAPAVPILSTTPAAAPPSNTGAAGAETPGAGAKGSVHDASATGPVSGAPASSNGTTSEGAGSEAGAPTPGAAAAPAVHLDAGSSEAILQSLASSPASSFAETLQSAKAATPALAKRQEAEVEKSYPEVERPTGIARGAGPGKAVPPPLGTSATAVVAPGGKSGGPPPPAKTQVATGPVPGADAPVSVAEPPAADGGGSWWDWLTGRLHSLLSSLPTTDPGVSTSAGPRPETDLSGEANPAQNEAIAKSGKEQVETQQARADTATRSKFGEDEIAPTVPGGKMRPRQGRGAALAGAHAGAKNSPVMPDDMRAQLDAAQGPAIKKELSQQLARQRQQQAEFEKASAKTQDDGKRRLVAENERARQEQMGIKQQARADVDTERERWRSENRKVLQSYSEGTQAKRAETEKQIDEKVKTTNKSVDDKLTEAEGKADQERAKAEQQAAQKKAEVENKPRGFWESLKGAVSSFFNEVKGAITHLFEEMRQAVKKIIDEAKTLVHEWIEAARQFVVGMIKAFGEIVKAAVSVALAAFPDLANKACDWIDRRVNDAVNAVSRVANALEKTVDSILDAVAAALDAALRAFQAAFLAILDGLETLSNAVLAAMEWMAKLAGLLKKFGAFLKGLGDLIATGVEKLLAEARKTLEQYIDQIPGKVEAFVQEQASKLGKTAAKHIQGIWRHLKPALVYLKDNWWTEVKQMVWNLVWPFNEKSPIWKDVPAMIKLPGKIIDSLAHGKVSEGADEYLELSQKLNSVVGVFYGWFFIASVLVGAIIGSIVPGPGTVAGAIAGASFAGEVGEGLLVAMIATETAVIAKAAYDLAFGPGTEQVNESAYDRIANSGLTLAITGAMMALGELAADLAKAIIDGVKGLFKGEGPEVPKVEVPKEEPKPGEPKGGEPAEGDIAAKKTTDDGHQVEVTKDGRCLICSSCEEVSIKYKEELDANSKLAKELEVAKGIADPNAKATEVARIQKELAKAREEAWKAETPEQKAKSLGDIRTRAKQQIEEIRQSLADPKNKEVWQGSPKSKAEIEAKLRELDHKYSDAVEGAEDIGGDPDLQDLAKEEFDDLRTEAEMLRGEVNEKLAPSEEFDVKAFEAKIAKMSPAERVATVSEEAAARAAERGLLKDRRLSGMNGRDVYVDPNKGELYSVDTQHGRFEECNARGVHQGEVDLGFNQTKPADTSGGHNLRVN